jgi:hypothetical protein
MHIFGGTFIGTEFNSKLPFYPHKLFCTLKAYIFRFSPTGMREKIIAF